MSERRSAVDQCNMSDDINFLLARRSVSRYYTFVDIEVKISFISNFKYIHYLLNPCDSVGI